MSFSMNGVRSEKRRLLSLPHLTLCPSLWVSAPLWLPANWRAWWKNGLSVASDRRPNRLRGHNSVGCWMCTYLTTGVLHLFSAPFYILNCINVGLLYIFNVHSANFKMPSNIFTYSEWPPLLGVIVWKTLRHLFIYITHISPRLRCFSPQWGLHATFNYFVFLHFDIF